MHQRTWRVCLLLVAFSCGASLLGGAYILGATHSAKRNTATGQDFAVAGEVPPPVHWPVQIAPVPGAVDPFQEMQRMHRQMEEMFTQAFGLMNPGGTPALSALLPGASGDVEFQETEKELLLRIELPGLDEGSFKVSVNEDSVELSGNTITERATGTGPSLRRERSTTSFHRSVSLPKRVDPGSAETDYENGILTLRLRKEG